MPRLCQNPLLKQWHQQRLRCRSNGTHPHAAMLQTCTVQRRSVHKPIVTSPCAGACKTCSELSEYGWGLSKHGSVVQVVASVLTRLAAQARVPIPASRYASGERRVEAWMDSIEKGTGELLFSATCCRLSASTDSVGISRLCKPSCHAVTETPADGCAQAEVVTAEVKLSEGQRRAIQQAANAPVMVLTGGPGCGKTFATATFVKLWRAMGRGHTKVALCAPTGACSPLSARCRKAGTCRVSVHC